MLDLNFSNFSIRVLIHLNVIAQLKSFRQLNRGDSEACGLLLGRSYNNAFEITSFTPPQLTDKRSRFNYVRSTHGHMELAIETWERSNGLIGYLGEWHSHPERIPIPSSKDLAEAKRITEQNNFPVVGLIVGYEYGCVFITTKEFQSTPQVFTLSTPVNVEEQEPSTINIVQVHFDRNN